MTNLLSYSSFVRAHTMTSSLKFSTPSKSSEYYISFPWKASGAQLIPYGRRKNWYRPNGVPKVQRSVLTSSSSIIQNPQQASRRLNTLAPCSFTASSVTVGSENHARRTARFKGLARVQTYTNDAIFFSY